MNRPYEALMSYTRFDDQNNEKYLTEFCKRLSSEVQGYTGKPFSIFQDIKDIKWGEPFEARIDHALDTITFFIPILTPSFFKSEFCRYELETFLAREKELGRSDLVLPVYYIEVRALEDKHLRDDPLAQTLAARQRIDWRDLRFEPFDAPQVRRTLAQMAQQIAKRIILQERERKQSEAEAAQQQRREDGVRTQPDKNTTDKEIVMTSQKPSQGWKNWGDNPFVVALVIITAVVTLLVAWPSLSSMLLSESESVVYAGRIIDSDSLQPVENTMVSFESEDIPSSPVR